MKVLQHLPINALERKKDTRKTITSYKQTSIHQKTEKLTIRQIYKQRQIYKYIYIYIYSNTGENMHIEEHTQLLFINKEKQT